MSESTLVQMPHCWKCHVVAQLCFILGTIFLRPIITTDLAGVEHIGPAFGLLTMVEGIGSAVGTPFGGRSSADPEGG